jgi:hypothetical protein
MKLSQIAPHFRETLGAYEAYRRLGYQPEVIFFMVLPTAAQSMPPDTFDLFMVLQSQGKSFRCLTAQGIPGPKHQLESDWKLAAKAWNAGHESTRLKIWEASLFRKNAADFILTLHKYGFTAHLDRSLN